MAASRSAVPVAVRGCRVHHQAITIFHEHMPHVAQLGGLPRYLAKQLGVRVGRRTVRLVAALLSMKVALTVAARCRWLAVAVLRTKALHRSPRLDQRSIQLKA